MNEINENKKDQDNQTGVGVPVAIVIAGALIAGAIYFGNTDTSKIAGSENVNEAEEIKVEQPQDTKEAAPENTIGDIRPVGGQDHIRGSEDAKITIIEYSDIECPFCKKFHPTMTRLLEEYPNDVRWVWRHLPLEQLHPNARTTALATECAGEQGKFWETIDYMLEEVEDSQQFAKENLPQLAQAAGVTNSSQFNDCLEEEKYDDKISSDMADARAAGGRGTPYSVIIGPNGEKEPIPGAQPYESVKAAVEKYL